MLLHFYSLKLPSSFHKDSMHAHCNLESKAFPVKTTSLSTQTCTTKLDPILYKMTKDVDPEPSYTSSIKHGTTYSLLLTSCILFI